MTSDDRTLDARYLDWLYKNIGPLRNRNPARSYWMLACALFRKEFVWQVPNDDNRVEDGRELRDIFLAEMGLEGDHVWLEEGCSMLEMLIALSRRLDFETEDTAFEWFWILCDNLELRPYVDETFSDDFNVDVDLILDRVIERTYKTNGRGGLFPLQYPNGDQREVEIWYQMAAYLMENDAS